MYSNYQPYEEEDEKRLRDLFRCFNLRKTDKAAETCQFISYPVSYTTVKREYDFNTLIIC